MQFPALEDKMKQFAKMAAFALLALGIAGGAKAQTLEVGSPAPKIEVGKWVKGDPIKEFEKGKVYVVEFWATWCGPCKQSIPHLTELQKKYAGKATVVGVSVFEEPNAKDEAYFEKVEKFVEEFGPKMEYTVAIDGKEATMATTWMEAAGLNGIPSAFIVNQEGIVAWIGHPMAGLDRALEGVVAGTFDVAAEKERVAKEKAAEEARMAEMRPIMELLQQEKYREAVAAMDEAFAKNQDLERALGFTKFMTMTEYDEAAAYGYAKQLADGLYKDQPMMLNQIAWTIVDDETPLKKPEIKFALDIAQRAFDQLKEDDFESQAFILDTLALAQFKDGQVAKAIANQEKALAAAGKATNFDQRTRSEMVARLERFKKKGTNSP
jgi:thiol-disulfide isomerase/thioredoxin